MSGKMLTPSYLSRVVCRLSSSLDWTFAQRFSSDTAKILDRTLLLTTENTIIDARNH